MSRVPKQFIKNLQGKDFVLFGGLLELAHQDGLKFTDTEILQYPTTENQNTCVVKALVQTEKGSFTGIGDASPASVPNKSIAVHAIRMAETRAIARALRVATNVSMTAFEELGDMTPESNQAPVRDIAIERAHTEIKKLCKHLGINSKSLADSLKTNYKTTWNKMDVTTARKVADDLHGLITGPTE